jgi:DNA-binding response OmpR family regulator
METIPRIMVVDDEERICRSVEKILRKNNYDVTCANSAAEAMEKMALQSFSLLISDIVMPNTNGLELLKLVKKEWPLTKAVMITAYASTDTAMKAIRLGALDYLPKPFTPDELRQKVNQALSGDLAEAPTTEADRESINIIDVDIPFDQDEVAKVAGDEYAKMLGRSDMPVVEVRMPEPLAGFCDVGNMVCDIFKKLGMTCKAGTKTTECPQLKAKKKTADAAKPPGFDGKTLIGVDQPFSYEEVARITGPEYIRNLHNGFSFVPYEELKEKITALMKDKQMDVDMPFDRDEVAKYTGETYVDHLSRSDIPIVEVKASQPMEGFCDVGNMVCDIFKKLGMTCKAGTKTAECPQLKAKKRIPVTAKSQGFDAKTLIAPDMPFNFEEVAAVTGSEYIGRLVREGSAIMPYEQLKENLAGLLSRDLELSPAQGMMQTVSDEKRILVVDDEVAVNNNIRKILDKKGFPVDQAFTKAEALDKIKNGFYELVLLDLKIPGVKGLELLEAVRHFMPHSRVIIVTGYASIETAVESARLGAVDYLAKPFTPDEIRNLTENALRLAA